MQEAAQSPSSLPASAALGRCVSISAASHGGACGVSKCPGGSIKGVVQAAALHKCV